jgi:hypothetical protein
MALIPCKECSQQISSDAKTCPHCGKEVKAGVGRGCLFAVLGFTVLVILIMVFAATDSQNSAVSPAVTDSKGRPVPAGVTNDAELLIARCGQPTSDDSTAYDNPRPPIPTRIIEYKNQKLRFMFIPGGGSNVGDPPPYKWKFVGTTDMKAADPSKARVVPPSEAVRRMPCWAGN